MRYILYIFIFLFASEILAQEFTVSGTLVDENNAPIAFASVLLLAENETIITGISSNESGAFLLKNLSANTYTLKITFVGYNEVLENFKLSANKNFGTIILKEGAEALKEVNITSTKPTLIKESDRLIFNVENTALSEGNLLEVLRSAPGVLILDNAITVKNSTPTVYINDRKVNLSASEITQLLENSPANTIKKVEVITNPPAKYDAESGAVLNIVMTRNLITGYRGTIFSNYTQGVFPRYNAGLNQFYKTNKINVNLNYSYSQNKINRDSDERINYFDAGSIDEKWLTNTNRNTYSKTHNVNLNFDYFLDDKNTLSFATNALLLPFFDYFINGKTIISDAENTRLYSFNVFNHSEDDKYNLGFDLDFVHLFKKKAKLTFNAHVTDYDYRRNQRVNSNYFLPDNTYDFSTAFNTLSNQDTQIFTTQVDYVLPLSDSAEFTSGLKSSNIETVSDIVQFDIDQSTGESTLNTANSNGYDYEESVFAAYLSYNKSWQKWSFSGGLRAENTQIKGLSIADNERNNQDYFKLFPTVNLSLEVTEKATIYTNYKRSISRPNYQSLNPFKFFLNDNTIVTGNPTLLPSFTSKYLLGSSLYDFLTIEVFYVDTVNTISEIPIQNNDNSILTFTSTNLDKRIDFGLDVEFYKSLSDRWFLYVGNSLRKIKEESLINNVISRQRIWSNYFICSNDFSFLKNKSLSLNMTIIHIGKNTQELQIVDPRLLTNVSIKKQLFNDRATLSLAIADLFNTQDFNVSYKNGNQDNARFTNLDNRYIKLGFSYKFGNTTLKTNEQTKSRAERERLEK